MSHHKRKGPKSTRSGCLLCKPHKHQGVDAPKRQELEARLDERDQIEEAANDCGCPRCWDDWSDPWHDDGPDLDFWFFPAYWPHTRVVWDDNEPLSAPLFEVAA